MWKKSYEEKKLDDIIFKNLKQEMDQKSLEIFADITFRCLQKYREQWSTMSFVVQKLKIALKFQDPLSLEIIEAEDTNLTESLLFGRDRGSKDNVDAVIEIVMRDSGFNRGEPIAAYTIYNCLVHWKSFESERTSVFDRLLQMIGSAIENHQDNNEHMAYWLSNTSALVFLIQKSLRPDNGIDSSLAPKPPPPTSLFARMTRGLRSSSVSLAAPAAARQVEANDTALLFKQQLTAYVEKIYGIVFDNMKKKVGSLLILCIQAPRTSRGVLKPGRSIGKDSQSSHWQGIVDCLNTLLKTLKDNFVPTIIVQKIFCQVFSYINVQLFNSLLLRRECCTFSNGEYVKAGLAELELWYCEAKEEYVGAAWDELKHVRQTIGFLVIYQKHRISYDEITNDLCPVLSVQQLYRICTLYWDDKYNTKSVSPEVISSIRALMTEDAASSSILLDDDSSIPLSVDDLPASLQVIDFADVKSAVELYYKEISYNLIKV